MFKAKLHLAMCFIMERIFYRRAFFIYRPLYFFYKNISDAGKIRRLRQMIKPGMTVLDIGANVGFYSVLFSKLVGRRGKVIAFEPEARNFSYLTQSVRGVPQIEIHQIAVGEKSESIRFYHSDMYNVDGRTYDPGDNRKTTLVACTSIDDHLAEGGKADVIKIDIQGYEYYAIKGMMRMLRAPGHIVIFGEFWPDAMRRAGVDARTFLELLSGFGFRVEFDSGLTPDEVLVRGEDPHFYTDFFATR